MCNRGWGGGVFSRNKQELNDTSTNPDRPGCVIEYTKRLKQRTPMTDRAETTTDVCVFQPSCVLKVRVTSHSAVKPSRSQSRSRTPNHHVIKHC